MRESRLTQRFWDDVSPSQMLPLAGAVFCLFLSTGFLLDALQNGGATLPSLAGLVLLSAVVTTAYLVGAVRRRGRLLVGAVVVHLLGLLGLTRLGPLTAGAGAITAARFAVDFAGMLATLAAACALLVRFQSRETQRRVRRERGRVERDLARDIKGALVPPVALEAPWCEIRGRSAAGEVGGGDLVDALLVGRRPLAFAAEVSGQGVAAGTQMGLLKAALRMRLRTSGDPDTILADLNDVLVALLRQGTTATAALVELEGPNRVGYALAGAASILHWRSAMRTVAELGNGAPVLGLRPGERYPVVHVDVVPGDVLAMLTGGSAPVADSTASNAGPDPVVRALATHADAPLADLVEQLLAAGLARRPEPRGDVTALALRVRPS